MADIEIEFLPVGDSPPPIVHGERKENRRNGEFDKAGKPLYNVYARRKPLHEDSRKDAGKDY